MSDLAVPSRRGFLRGAVMLLAAPAIVRVASIMPVSVLPRIDDFSTARLRILDSYGSVATGRGISTAQLREILRPGLEQLFLESMKKAGRA